MIVWDFLLLALVAFCVVMAVRSIRKKGGCAACGGDCERCREKKTQNSLHNS